MRRTVRLACLVTVAVALPAAGCGFDAAVPAGARILCDGGRDCATGHECRAGGLCAPFEAEQDPPALVDPVLQPKRGGAGTAFELSLTFDEPLAALPQIGPLAFTVEPAEGGDGGRVFVARFVAPDDDALHGVHPLAATFHDRYGNESKNQHVDDLVLDYVAPQVVAATVLVSYSPPQDGIAATAAALGDGGSATLTFSVDDIDVVESPRASAAGRTLVLAAAAPPSFSYGLAGTADLPNGPLDVTVELTDSAGNTAVQTLTGALLVDTVAPAAPDGTHLTLARVPWGDAAGGPRSSVSGDGLEAGARVVLFASPSLDGGLLGSAVALQGGVLAQLPIAVDDAAAVYAAQIDGAGQIGPFARVRNVSWRATLMGKIAGSTFENPHRVIAQGGARTGALTDVGPAFGAVERGGQQDADGVLALALQTSTKTAAMPGFLKDIAYDAARGAVIGLSGGSVSRWTGQDVARIRPDDPEGDGDPLLVSALVADDAADRVLVCADDDGARVWSWDGHSSRAIDDGGAFPNRAAGVARGTACAFDGRRGVAVAYGGVDWPDDGTVIEIDAADNVRRVLPAGGGPPARSFAKLTYDPVSARILLVDGIRFDAGGMDAWAWDGVAWTELPRPSSPTSAVLFNDGARAQLFDDDGALWSFDGAGAWSPFAGIEPLPQPVAAYAAAWDWARGELLALSTFATFAWDGAAWSQVQTGGAASGPGAPRVDVITAAPDADGDGLSDGFTVASELMISQFDGRWRGAMVTGTEPPRCAAEDGAGTLVFYDSPVGGDLSVFAYDGGGVVAVPVPAPPPLTLGACAYSPALGTVVVSFLGGEVRSFTRAGGFAPLPGAVGVDLGEATLVTGPGPLVTAFARTFAVPTRETWVLAFDGTSWTTLGTNTPAVTVAMPDPAHERLLLGDGQGEFWTWDGAVFTPLPLPVDVYGDGEPASIAALAPVGDGLFAIEEEASFLTAWQVVLAERPAVAAIFDLRPARLSPGSELVSVTASARIAGTGGAALEVFDGARWSSVATTAAVDDGAPVSGALGGAGAARAIYRNAIEVRAVPLAASSADVPVEVNAAQVVLDVSYRLPP